VESVDTGVLMFTFEKPVLMTRFIELVPGELLIFINPNPSIEDSELTPKPDPIFPNPEYTSLESVLIGELRLMSILPCVINVLSDEILTEHSVDERKFAMRGLKLYISGSLIDERPSTRLEKSELTVRPSFMEDKDLLTSVEKLLIKNGVNPS
jgi:hypothetical protein